MKITEDAKKLRSELIERLKLEENTDILQEVREILDRIAPRKDWWDNLRENQKALARKGRAELEAGKGIPAEEVLRRLKR